MRIATELRVQALVRRVSAGGASAYIVRRGDAERGALFVKVATLDGRATLWGPAPASLDDSGDERPLAPHLDSGGVPEKDVDGYIARQTEFDPDLWLIEIEDRAGRSFLDD